MSVETPPDISTLQWVINGIVGLGIAAAGWLVKRMGEIEDKIIVASAANRTAHEAGDREIWRIIEEDRKASLNFRENILARMVTKGDMSQMEGRLIQMETRIVDQIHNRRKSNSAAED